VSSRAAGILLHPTSLPGRFGIGDLGPEAEHFLEWAAAAGQRLWQVLPTGPTAYLNSPYGSLSAFAGNPLLISPEELVEDGFLPASALKTLPGFPHDHVEFEAVIPWKEALLRQSWAHFQSHATPAARVGLETFRTSPQQTDWLPDFALFVALMRKHDSKHWNEWPADLAHRRAAALSAARRELADEIAFQEYVQFLFFRQWTRLKHHANELGIQIFGDIPIYVAFQCADVWAHQSLFALDADGNPLTVAGVPPDAFSDDGQRWGNPLYRWDRMAETDYAWWIARIGMSFRLADVVRIDHFRGFAGFWEVPAHHETALNGRWVTGPGLPVFEAIRKAYGDLAIVAEDLGVITEDVRELLTGTGFPGMKVLQFAFGEIDSEYLPHRHIPNSVVYTGTHDNDTTRGWFRSLGTAETERVLAYIGGSSQTIEWDLIRAAYTSVADRVVVPLQDILGLGNQARLNMPGLAAGNWAWRATRRQLRAPLQERLRRLAELTGRLASPP